MKIRKWMKRMVILDLCMIGLLLFYQISDAKEMSIMSTRLGTRQMEVMSTAEAVRHKVMSTQYPSEMQGKERKIAITFDDGPHPYYTEQLLDGLENRGVKATFFVTGEHAQLHPDIIERMAKEGHTIGNHTYSHIQLKEDNSEKFKEELIMTNEIIQGITGESVCFVRPPYGIWDKSLEAELSMIPVMWTIDPMDWCLEDTGKVVDKVVGRAKENDIILMHDYYKSSVLAALEVVDELQDQGYVFVTVEELMLD